MQLDDQQRKMVRLAFKSRDPELRRRVLQRLLKAKLASGTRLGPHERQLVRMAFTSSDPILRRGILESLRIARYAEEFMQGVEGQTFHNPETGNQVKFVSLPHTEQQKIYQQWAQAQQGAQAPQESEPKGETKPETQTPQPSGKHKDRKELRAKPKAKMSDTVGVSEELTELLVPEGMSETSRETAKKALSEAKYELLEQLRNNAEKALEKPNGAYMKGLLAGGYTEEGVRKMHKGLNKALEAAEGKKYHPTVLSVANMYDLESEDADELRDFKGDKPHRGRKLNPQELFQKFMQKAKPETRERMKSMDLNDFMAMYNSIMAEEEEESPAKTASRLPRQPHAEVLQAIQEGRLAVPLTVFDEPEDDEPQVALSAEEREIVRLAYASQDPQVRRQVLALLSV